MDLEAISILVVLLVEVHLISPELHQIIMAEREEQELLPGRTQAAPADKATPTVKQQQVSEQQAEAEAVEAYLTLTAILGARVLRGLLTFFGLASTIAHMNISRYRDDLHYDMLKEWWEARNLMPVPQECLPAYGAVVDGIVAGFLYQTDSKVCMIENLISDKRSAKDERRRAIDSLIKHICQEAKRQGFNYVIGYTISDRLIRDQSRWGFSTAKDKCSVLVRKV